ncbi:MAG: hypothetical protein S4CHLAM102_00850 [Chlamydiia bacterium]|nr:hypothetical protein [Chlamydiia bacterium]
MTKWIYTCIFFISLAGLFAANGGNTTPPEFPLPLNATSTEEKDPNLDEVWLTGPLLCPSPKTIPPNHANVQPYVFFTRNLGFWNNRWKLHSTVKSDNINFQLPIQIGLTPFMDFEIVPQVITNYYKGNQRTEYGDLPLSLNLQILNDNPHNRVPAIKLSIGEIFPTGAFSDLNPDKNGTDAGGAGGFSTPINIIISKLFRFGNHHNLATRFNVGYQYNATVGVTGFNTYGGGFGTEGTINPGNSLTAIVGLEFTLTQHWALASDFMFIHEGKTTFSGNKGKKADGVTDADIGKGEVYEWSIAPAIEYNFTRNIGAIAGFWFDVYGENTIEFQTAIVSINFFI